VDIKANMKPYVQSSSLKSSLKDTFEGTYMVTHKCILIQTNTDGMLTIKKADLALKPEMTSEVQCRPEYARLFN